MTLKSAQLLSWRARFRFRNPNRPYEVLTTYIVAAEAFDNNPNSVTNLKTYHILRVVTEVDAATLFI